MLHSLGKFSGTSVVVMKRQIVHTSNHILLQDANKADLTIYLIFNQFLLNTHYNTNKVNGQGKGNNTDNSQRTNNV